MAAPRFSPVGVGEAHASYRSPDVVPDQWTADRPGDIVGFQPAGPLLGAQGPDQGFALRIANGLRPNLRLQAGEKEDDVVRGCLGVALRRASLFSRAPVVHDLTIAFTVWGFFDVHPPTELVTLRAEMFEGVRLVVHHYAEARAIADQVPEATLRMTPAQVTAAYPGEWHTLLGL